MMLAAALLLTLAGPAVDAAPEPDPVLTPDTTDLALFGAAAAANCTAAAACAVSPVLFGCGVYGVPLWPLAVLALPAFVLGVPAAIGAAVPTAGDALSGRDGSLVWPMVAMFAGNALTLGAAAGIGVGVFFGTGGSSSFGTAVTAGLIGAGATLVVGSITSAAAGVLVYRYTATPEDAWASSPW